MCFKFCHGLALGSGCTAMCCYFHPASLSVLSGTFPSRCCRAGSAGGWRADPPRLRHLASYLQWKERTANPALLQSSSKNTLRGWVCRDLITVLAIGETRWKALQLGKKRECLSPCLCYLGWGWRSTRHAGMALLSQLSPPCAFLAGSVTRVMGGNRVFSATLWELSNGNHHQ